MAQEIISAVQLFEWPDKISGRVWMPDDGDFSSQDLPPLGIVLHSGEKGADVAKYAEHEPDGRKISYHFAWSVEHDALVQMVSLNDRAWHAGEEGNDWIGIALPGPWNKVRGENEFNDLRVLVVQLQDAFAGTLVYWTRHSDLCRKRKDPGPGVDGRWCRMLREHGLAWVDFANMEAIPEEYTPWHMTGKK